MTIRILPARLANQIAAGEVVERPASVVKELLENCLDAGATKIEVDIVKGGHKRILVRDNGRGIEKDELTLALSRHATSKIATLEDLESISSLGFRGEALASISSVSRLTLTSRPLSQPQAWQAHAEGRDMEVQINPSAHPPGTSVDVMDLFFNTPARRKFLRTEKTEFTHIDELFKRAALSHYRVHFVLKHNDKIIRNYPAVAEGSGKLKRAVHICGRGFKEHALQFTSEYQDIRFAGWLCDNGGARSQNDQQYCYINGRMMRDKLISHAIRQAYEGLIEPNSYPAYVVYLTMPTEALDVNVHPTKQEVRFHQARLIHDFIYKTVNDALQQQMSRMAHESNTAESYRAENDEQSNSTAIVDPERTTGGLVGEEVKGYLKDNTTQYGAETPSESENVLSAQTSKESISTSNAQTFSREYQNLHEGKVSHGYIKPLQQSSQQSKEAQDASLKRPVQAAGGAPNWQRPNAGKQASQNYQQLMQAGAATIPTKGDLAQVGDDSLAKPQVGNICLPIDEKHMLVRFAGQIWTVPVFELQRLYMQSKLSSDMPVGQPLLMPIAITVDQPLLDSFALKQEIFEKLNIEIIKNNTKLVLRKVPAGFRQLDWSGLMQEMLKPSDENDDAYRFFSKHVISQLNTFSDAEQLALWEWGSEWLSECIPLDQQISCCRKVDVKTWLVCDE